MMKKKLFSMLMVCVLAVCLCVPAFADEFMPVQSNGEELPYVININGNSSSLKGRKCNLIGIWNSSRDG